MKQSKVLALAELLFLQLAFLLLALALSQTQSQAAQTLQTPLIISTRQILKT